MQSLSAFAGLISMVLLLVVAIVAGRYMAKSNVSSAASEAQKNAIDAMQTEMVVLRGRIDDVKKENADIKKDNARLQFVMETIQAALKSMEIIISIEGDMIKIKDGKENNTTVTRIHGTGWAKEDR